MDNRRIIVLAVILFVAVTGCVNNKDSGSTVTTIQVGQDVEVFFTSARTKTVEKYDGVVLEDVVTSSGVAGPEAYTYTFVGGDGYQKTVKWADLKQGILTRDRMVVFPHLPKMYRVRDVVEVRVNG
jgi:hypothetical protein